MLDLDLDDNWYLLTDYLSNWDHSLIFSSAWLCQQSSWNRNSFGVRRPSVRLWHRLPLNLLHGFLSNFSSGFPWAICPDEIFRNFYEYITFLLTWDPRGATISKRYSYKWQPKVFKLFLNFLPNDPHKTTFGIFEILKIEILTNFIRFR